MVDPIKITIAKEDFEATKLLLASLELVGCTKRQIMNALYTINKMTFDELTAIVKDIYGDKKEL